MEKDASTADTCKERIKTGLSLDENTRGEPKLPSVAKKDCVRTVCGPQRTVAVDLPDLPVRCHFLPLRW